MNQTSLDQASRPLVPPAERPFIPFDQQETVQETIWYNPTERDVLLKLHVGAKPVYSDSQKARFREVRLKNPLQYKEWRSGERTLIIPARSERAISADFDQAIQQTQCLEPECVGFRLYCRDRSHHKQVMGGLGPQLINRNCQYRPLVHPSLIEANALEEENKRKAYEALLAKQAADTAMILAQAKIAQAEAAQLTSQMPAQQGAQAQSAKKTEK